MLWWFARYRRNLPFRHLFWLFGLFIIACGTTHLLEFISYHHPIYRFSGLVKLITALASWGTVVALVEITPHAMQMKTPEDLEKEIELRTAELDESAASLRLANQELHREADQRLRAQLALHESEERLRLAVDAGKIGIWQWDVKTGKGLWSELCKQLLGLPTRSKASYETFQKSVHPEDWPRVQSALEAAQKVGGEFREEYRVVRPDGAIRWVLGKGQAEFNASGKPISMMGVVMDVTSERESQDKIEALNQELEVRVSERTSALKAANDELEAFCYSVSHDLRAPLRTIDGFASALWEDHAETLGEDGVDSLRRVRNAARRMDELIDSLLKLSRVTRQQVRREHVNLSEIARGIAVELQKAQPDRRAQFSIQENVRAFVDPLLTRVALTNLMDNAWKFTARRAETRIEFGRSQDGRFFVRDNGEGFNPSYRDKLFVPFERLHSAQEFPGTGIGLATVQRIINKHGGEVEAEGREQEGATFYFTL